MQPEIVVFNSVSELHLTRCPIRVRNCEKELFQGSKVPKALSMRYCLSELDPESCTRDVQEKAKRAATRAGNLVFACGPLLMGVRPCVSIVAQRAWLHKKNIRKGVSYRP